MQIRPAAREDLSTLRDIEWASGQRYRDHGLDHVADDEPAPVEVLARYADRPLYEHLGFRVLSENEISPGIQGVRELEADHGLDPDLRVVMRLDLYW